MKKALLIFLCAVMLTALSSCGNDGYEIIGGSTAATTQTTATAQTQTVTGSDAAPETNTADEYTFNGVSYSPTEYNYQQMKINNVDIASVDKGYDKAKDGAQLEMPKKGEEIAVITTSKGVIKARLFEDQVPLTVTNFKMLAKQGYYNGMIWHRVMNDFMIQGGDPMGTGYGGKCIYGDKFEDEYDRNLFNFRGALAMANSGGGTGTNGSQFFINQVSTCQYDAETLKGYGWPGWAAKKYQELGGNFYLDNVHTVFGQVFEGLDVVDKIAAVETNPDDDKPLNNVYIYDISIVAYEG